MGSKTILSNEICNCTSDKFQYHSDKFQTLNVSCPRHFDNFIGAVMKSEPDEAAQGCTLFYSPVLTFSCISACPSRPVSSHEYLVSFRVTSFLTSGLLSKVATSPPPRLLSLSPLTLRFLFTVASPLPFLSSSHLFSFFDRRFVASTLTRPGSLVVASSI